ncbi:LOW QUALITY PROTEIN: leucine-rich repeat-containing protein 9 [Spheniscus humboldti]
MDMKRIIVAFHFQYKCNGLSYENIDQEVKTTALEMFFSGYPRIVGMKYFPNITTLILIGQGIQKILDPEYCLLLKELWIAECCLVKIDGLQKWVNLQKLYLCNEISRTENLLVLTKLNVLWLNNNLIKNIEGLHTLQNLQEVNLTGNLIEKIGIIVNSQDSRTLNVLQRIRIQFQFCRDDNYLNLVSQALDQLERELAELQMLGKTSSNKSLRSKNLETENAVHDNGTEKTCLEKAFLQKINALEERITFRNRKLNEIKDFQVEMKKSFSLVVQFLLMELETVGNIHFEEALSNNPWFRSCYIIKSRFCTWDFRAYSIMGMKINRIFRVHNQILRLKFKETFQIFLKEVFSIAERAYAYVRTVSRWICIHAEKMESLSYVCNPELPVEEKQLLQMLEDSFQGLEVHTGWSQLNKSLCECPRTEFLKQANAEGKNRRDPEKSFKHGKAIIAKVFLGRSAPACAMNSIYQVNYPEANSVFRPWKCLESDASTSGNEMRASLEQRSCDYSYWHCEWFVFDHELVLPEYIAEFEHFTLDSKTSVFSTCNIIVEEGKRSTERFILSHDLQRDDEALNREPTVHVKPQIACLNEKTPIFSVAKANISQVQILNSNGNSLSKLQDISRLKTLQKLIISFNEFASLNIYDLPKREYFDASHNHVITLEGIRGLHKLQFFNLSWNQLKKSREDINILHKNTPISLDITHSPWHKPASLQLSVIGQLKALTNLDGVLISNEEAAKSLQYIAGSKMAQVSLLYSRTDEEKTLILSVFPYAKILSQILKNKVDSQMHCNNWYSMITVLNLDDQLFKISNLEKLEHLSWASFSNNNLTLIEGIESCLNLEELTLDENYISTLDGISKLTKLTRHSVNNNHLISLKRPVFENLSYPHYISIENNRITSLVGLKKTYSLTELYISNNFVYTNQETHHLKGLTNLIILDMSRNIVWKQDHYRLLVLFHLPSLKALDGIAVEPTEGEGAKNLFGGKLTSDMFADRLGHSDFTEMQELNWTASNISAVELVPADQFRNVCGMNLQNNNRMSFSGLIFLPNAKVLCLNYSHTESILPGQKLPNQVTNRQQLYNLASHGYGQEGLAKESKNAEFGENLPLIMQSLEDFHLGCNGITNVAQLQLSRLKNLKLLFLQSRNQISQIEGLEGLKFLQKLLLDRNHINMISQGFLASQNGLLTLHLEQNQIQELNSLQPVVKSQKLFLDFNRIQESSELEKLHVIPSLKRFPVANFPEDSGFPALPANFTRHNPLRITNGNLNENINHLFGSDLMFGHELEEPLLNKSNESKHKQTGLRVPEHLT